MPQILLPYIRWPTESSADDDDDDDCPLETSVASRDIFSSSLRLDRRTEAKVAVFYTRCLQDLPKITITHVHRIVQAASSTPRSKREKGYKMYISSYIDNYEVSNRDSSGRVSIRATCYRSMRKSEKPHDLRIVFEDRVSVDIAVAECSCVAGTALCNHNVALLFQTAHYSTLNLAAVPPVLSCTETEQRWHKPRTMGVKPGRVSDMVFLSSKPKQFTVADGVRSKRYKAVRGELPDPDVLKVDEQYKDFTADIAPLITTMAISADVPLVDSAFGKVQAGSPISYQHPVPVSRVVVHHPDAPLPSPLPVDGYRLEPTNCQFVCSHQQHLHLQSLVTTFDMARKIEVATRGANLSVSGDAIRFRFLGSRFDSETIFYSGTIFLFKWSIYFVLIM
ncbi:uncharacterized protein LOC143525969 isoform X2 [Brachyhypopomus gauderio]|uniref:uncharacterized protein LOC143525969 isoform X2 n=1 Tax=Brachyhypopomus gauderio TaxID=698409 RepID=UPI0040411F9F